MIDIDAIEHTILGTPLCPSCGKGMHYEISLRVYYCPVCEKEEIEKMCKKSKDHFVEKARSR